ncbi:MAG: ABC transporter ATP-binding protein [Chloroflexota bacterium]|nr:MAG: ABC transporter ATP-binding protein [Chloroflexota bacterium]
MIQTVNLTKTYTMGESEVHALSHVNLAIEGGDFVALMGASGSGKSTLLHLLGCLDTPSEGQYYLEGRDVGMLSKDERARVRNQKIGFIFQNFNLLPHLTALENVALPLLYQKNGAGRGQASIQERANEALEQVGLVKRANHLPTELSGGERQRIAIARALVTSPALLLADEPTGNLDSATGADIMGLLAALWREGRTILVVTHDAQVAAFTRRILQMRDGQIVGELCHSGISS